MTSFGINSFNLKNLITRKIKRDSFIWSILGLFQGISFQVNYLLYYKLKFLTRRNSIHEIHLEFVSYCNLRCQLCSLDHEKPKIRMSASLLKHFFDDFLSDKRFRNVTTIHLYNAGEVLLHPELETMLAIIKDYKNKAEVAKIRFPQIGLLTNATILNEKNSKILINANILNHIRFSMDGGTREKFEEMRTRANWDVFVKNIEVFCNLNKLSDKPVKTGIISLLEFKNKLTTDWMSCEFIKLLEMVDGYELRYAHNWAGDLQLDEIKNKPTKKKWKAGCSLLMHQLVVLPNGKVTVCCADLNSKGVIGNILKEKLSSIYDAPKRLQMLKMFMNGEKHKIDLCRDCETF